MLSPYGIDATEESILSWEYYKGITLVDGKNKKINPKKAVLLQVLLNCTKIKHPNLDV